MENIKGHELKISDFKIDVKYCEVAGGDVAVTITKDDIYISTSFNKNTKLYDTHAARCFIEEGEVYFRNNIRVVHITTNDADNLKEAHRFALNSFIGLRQILGTEI